MQIRTGKDRFSRVVFWLAVSLSSVSFMARGHDRVLDVVMGVAGAIFVLSLGRLAYCRLRVRG